MPTRPRPDECNDTTIDWLMDAEWADGIVKIHADCVPPCPRKQVALRFKQQVSGR
ncbi:hypothetical protein [Nocardia abscessus]|uniref:hypothetical protein n=1 Tax=Nocardia abscessus TaxID=120957 RepID=UPI000313F89D|nr:hypothetical protein [Nocardia abscessus]MCC3333611.1 hypothetical protein [Nocardia abscessus]